MRRGRLRWLGIAMLVACGLPRGGAKTPQRVAPKVALRVAPGPRGLRGASIPTVAPSTEQVLLEGGLAGISDGIGDVLDDAAAREGEAAWLGVVLTRREAGIAHTLVLVRRAAFGVHIPAQGERDEVDDDVLDDRGIVVANDAVALIGPDGVCLSRRTAAVVTALETGGHQLDVRWPLLDCGPGPWAPVGLVSTGIPTTLRWEPPQCDEPEDIAAAWESADTDTANHLGVLRDGERIVALVGEGVLWVATAKGWVARAFSTGIAIARGCPSIAPVDAGDAEPIDPAEADPSELDASEIEDTA